MSNAIQNSHSAPAHKAGRSFTRFVRASVKPVVFKLSRKLSVTYWPGRRRSISAVLLALLSGFVPGLAGAAPTGGQVVAGSAVVLKPTSSTTQVNQSSQNAIINWQSFSIGAGEAVRFVQPSASAVALNRVIGSDPSLIFGSLTANGKVFLVNSAGVYFAPGASVDVGGLVASSMNISNSSFLSGKYKFEAGANAGAVTNDGQLRGAFVVLAAPKVSNAGSIVTTGGTTALAAGGRVSLDIAGDKLVSMSVDAATANAAVSNSGSISADGGKVFMTASSANAVLDTVINTSGIVRAGSIVERNGQIVIDGGAAGTVQVSGTLAASGVGAGTAGGAVQVLGQRIALQGGANIDVSGDTGGGSALVGGDLHGAGGVKTAAFTEVSQGAVINADALTSGDGGKVVVWADQHTGFRGAISAKGGAAGGDGGFVETSGKSTLAFAGKVNTTAAHGVTGTLLLDPTDITISNAADSGGAAEAGGVVTATGPTSNLNVGTLIGVLSSSNIIVDTASGQPSTGHIDVIDAVSWNNANSLTLKSNGHIAVSAPITNNGSGGISLQAGGAINTGSLSSNGGTISVIGNAGVVIDGALATTNNTASAIIVNAGATGIAGAGAGGDVTISGGSLTVGAGGRATIYTGTVGGSTGVPAAAGLGLGNFRYNSDSTTTNFTAALGTGVNVVYREQPTLTIGVTNAGIIYGEATPTFTPTYNGLQNGDLPGQALSSGSTVGVSAGTSGSGHVVAGTHTLTPSAVADQLGYGLAYTNGTLTVAKKVLVAGGSTVTTRDYDGTTAATVNTSTAAVASGGATSADGNAYTLDDVSVNTAAVTTGTFADKNAGVAKAVTIAGLTLQGADAANYTVSGSASGTIAPKALTATMTAPDKVYDGNTTAAPTLSITGGLVGGETVGASGTATFNSKDVLTANLVTVQSAALVDGAGGGLAANYTLGTGQTATAHITPKALTAAIVSADKTYDGTTGATAVMSIDPAGLVGTETVTASGTGTFNTKDVLTANLVTVSAVALGDGANGGVASNYGAAAGQTGAAQITAKTLTATVTAPDKVYDGNTTAAPVLSITSGLVGTETVTATGTASFNTKDVVTANQVTVNSASLADGANGGLASNYDLAAGQTATAHITPKALTASLVLTADKTYDGNASAAASMSVDTGLVGTETVTALGIGFFNTRDVLTANLVTVSAVVLVGGANGGRASNYSAAAGQTGTAHITPKTLTAIATAPDKVYDGNTNAAPVLGIDSGLVGLETVAVSGTGAFNTKDVLTANRVTVSTVSLADGAHGGLASNYGLAAGQTTTAHITPKALTASVVMAADKTYDGSTSGAASMSVDSGLVGTETVTASGTGAFNTKDVLTANLVTVNNVVLADGANGGLASNYSAAAGQTGVAHITPKALAVSLGSANKVYDGTAAAAASMSVDSGLVGTETVTASGTGTFNTKDVLTANLVTASAVALADGANGGLASNYSATSGQTYAAHITPKSLTATVTAPDKVYDGNTTAAPVLSIASGLVGTETVTATGTASFNTKDVVTANQVIVNSASLADGGNGGLASNYELAAGQTATAHITPKALTASLVLAADKTYDGSASAAASMSVDSGLVGTETVTASGTGAFNTKDVLSANLVTVNNVVLADGANGGLASNYSAAAGQTGVAHITPKTLTATMTAPDKVYDGNTNAAPVLSIDSGLVGAETVAVSGSGAFNSKDVVVANQVTVSSVALTDGVNGGLASNYDLAAGQTATAHITPKALTASLVLAADKTYDGGTSAAASMNVDSGLVGTETVMASGTGAFNTKDVLTANLVTVNNVVLTDGANGGLASNYSAAAGQTGVAHITPKTLTATITAPDKIYDGNTNAAPVLSIASGLVGSETVAVSGSGAFNSKDVLTANQVTVSTVSLADGANGGLASNYDMAAGQTAAAHITPKALTASVVLAADKTYDGSSSAAASMSVDSGLVGTETVTASGAGAFNTKDVLTANLVTVNNVVLTDGANGGLASNYSATAGQTGVAHIAPKALMVSLGSANKVYDGTDAAAASMSVDSGLIGTETVTASGTATFNSKNVLTANLVTASAVALADGANGGLASNYSATSGQTYAAHITAKSLTATVTAPDKAYDGNTTAAPVLSISSGLVGAETVAATGTASFNTKDVVTANQVTVNSASLADGNGGLASNYDLGTGQTGTAHITPKALTLTLASSGKVYDGNTNAAAVMSVDPSGLVNSETVTATGNATFNTKDVLTANLVTVNTVALADGANGGLSSNYSAASGQTATAHITPKTLTATMTAPDKVYDGNTNAAPILSIDSGLVGAETVAVSGSGAFNSKDVLAANQVTVSSVLLADGANGGLASNYGLSAGQTAAAHITPKALAASVVLAADKTYDGGTSAAASMNADSGLVGTETVMASGTGAFNTKDVLTANLVTVNNVVLTDGANGGLASNYSATAGQTGVAHIAPKALMVSLGSANKVYDGTDAAAASMSVDSGLVGTETVTASGTATFNSKNVLTANLVTASAVALGDGANGGLASNYSASSGQTYAAHITAKSLTATVTAPDKAYDGNTTAAPVLSISSGLVGTETVAATGTASFNTKDVVTANQVTVNSASLADGTNGGLASNYHLGTGQTSTAHVTPKALTLTLATADKVYDGNANAAAVLSVNPSGLVGSETVTAAGNATFNTKDVLTADRVTANTVALANGANGGLASNYSAAAGQTATAHIAPKALTATVATTTKVYDGNTSASTVMNISGLVGTETVTGTGAGVFNSKNVNTANQVTVNSVLLANGTNGGLASNYSLGSGQVGTGSITVRPSVTWTGPASGNWSDAANWEAGAIPDFANVANVVIPTGKSVMFDSTVAGLLGAVRIAALDGGGMLNVSNGNLTVANALQIGSYAQAAGQVNAASLKANSAFSQTGGKVTVAGQADITQASGAVSLSDFGAASLSISGGANVTQLPSSAVIISDTLTLATGSGDVTLSGVNNNFNKVVIGSAHNVTLAELGTAGISLAGSVAGDLNLSANGPVSQSAALSVQGSTVIDTGGAIKLDDMPNAFHGRVEVNSGGDTRLASSGALAIGGDVGGNLVLTSAGAVSQASGDALLVNGTSSVDAGTNAIALTAAGNHFTKALVVKGGAVSLVDSGALLLGQSTAGTLSVKTGGALSQAGKLAVAGTAAIDATGKAVVLNDNTNTFGGKVTLNALSVTLNTVAALDLNATVVQSLSVAAANATVTTPEALSLHLQTAATTVNAAKALSVDGAVTGPLTATAGGAVTQTAALTVTGDSVVNAAGQNITLTQAGNDFGGSLALTGANTQVVDKNALSLGTSAISGTFKASAKGDVTQKGALTVAGTSAIDTTGSLVLSNAANDFKGAVDAAATSVTLADQNLLTMSKVTAGRADLSAGTELQMASGGLIDAADITLTLPASAVKGAIGSPASSFAVKNGARVNLGTTTPAVPVYLGGTGVTLVVFNPIARLAYLTEVQPELFVGGNKVFNDLAGGATSTINSQISQILEATQKKADSNAELIDRGLGADLTVPIPYPHTGLVKALAPRCQDGTEEGCK